MYKRLLVALVLLAGLVSFPAAARAESIQSISNDVTISQSGTAQFLETIVYNFTASRHGIYRDIPISTSTPDGKFLNYDLTVSAITRDGKAEPFQQIGQGSFQQLKIGNANATIDGVHTYVIDYSLSPFVRKDPAGDYITINLHGTLWEVAAEQVKGTVTLPPGVKIQTKQCFTGAQGSSESNCTVTLKGENAVEVTSNGQLPAKSGLTLDLVVPSGSFSDTAYITPSDTARTATTSDSTSTTKGYAGLIAIVIALAFGIYAGIRVSRSAMRRRKNQKAQTIVAQYEAPDGTLPGEVGLIHDEVADTTEITATLIDLARRGHLKITYEEKKQLLSTKQRFLLNRLQPSEAPADFEKLLLDGIFREATSAYVDALQPATMAVVVEHVRKNLEARMKARGWYREGVKILDIDHLSADGYKEWAKVEGLKLYLNVAEKDRMEFAEAPAKTPERFTKLLPYAIALGVEKEWAKQFEGIDITPATQNWYVGNNVGNSLLFTNLLSDTFAASVSTNFSPPSSSGGAGGGFSGGGGGGGGGGSW